MRKPKTVKERKEAIQLQVMKLKDFIDNAIWFYPSLYKGNTYEESRILVLGHVFLSYGTGLEWHPNGFLADLGFTREGDDEYCIYKECKLPDNFFTAKIWQVDLMKKDLPTVKKLLEGHLCYERPRCLRGELQVIFEADEELAEMITTKYGVPYWDEEYLKERKAFLNLKGLLDKPQRSEVKAYRRSPEVFYEPSSMCKYSPLVEMVKGETNSPHIDNFKLKHIQPDWIEGAAEIARYTLDFYTDPKKCVLSHYHPTNCFADFKRLYDQDPKKFREERKADGMLPEHTIEEWCQICWEKCRTEQIGYCQAFLAKFYEVALTTDGTLIRRIKQEHISPKLSKPRKPRKTEKPLDIR